MVRPASSALLQAQLNRVADFLPVFESERFEFGTWTPTEKQEDGSFHLPWFSLSAHGQRFVEVVHDLGEALPGYDWAEWIRTPAGRRLRTPAGCKRATARQVAQVLFALVRGERFCEGTLSSAYDSGLLAALVRRADALRRQAEAGTEK